ncbi:hypothetical protein [Clostridium kluyveri]|uniref:hypothetical protein n=1 Tax=Clostridium kluyveri TaxID=1534 RepID=UPI002246A2CE|nr:hypothetical protein [Clostridium kluyveri]UZQ49873.1 hypothetical protein OP486_18285 [Clostridium kluyveri]
MSRLVVFNPENNMQNLNIGSSSYLSDLLKPICLPVNPYTFPFNGDEDLHVTENTALTGTKSVSGVWYRQIKKLTIDAGVTLKINKAPFFIFADTIEFKSSTSTIDSSGDSGSSSVTPFSTDMIRGGTVSLNGMLAQGGCGGSALLIFCNKVIGDGVVKSNGGNGYANSAYNYASSFETSKSMTQNGEGAFQKKLGTAINTTAAFLTTVSIALYDDNKVRDNIKKYMGLVGGVSGTNTDIGGFYGQFVENVTPLSGGNKSSAAKGGAGFGAGGSIGGYSTGGSGYNNQEIQPTIVSTIPTYDVFIKLVLGGIYGGGGGGAVAFEGYSGSNYSRIAGSGGGGGAVLLLIKETPVSTIQMQTNGGLGVDHYNAIPPSNPPNYYYGQNGSAGYSVISTL